MQPEADHATVSLMAMGKYAVAGLVAVGAAVITDVILDIAADEISKRRDRQPSRPASPVREPKSLRLLPFGEPVAASATWPAAGDHT